MKQLTLRETQLAALETYKALRKICDQLDVRYTIAYGSLIGAIRHKGFIPWDDDLDLLLPRPDYDKLCRYLNAHAEQLRPYQLDTFQKTQHYPFYIARFTDTRYHLEFTDRKYTSGIFVDLYPLDGLGDEKGVAEWRARGKKLLRVLKHLTLSNYPGFLYGDGMLHKIGNLPNCIYSKVLGRNRFFAYLDRAAHEYTWEESRFVAVKAWDVDVPIVYERTWLEETVMMPFEDTEVPVPKEYDRILRMTYGDYMQLPPGKNRQPHHEYSAYLKVEG